MSDALSRLDALRRHLTPDAAAGSDRSSDLSCEATAAAAASSGTSKYRFTLDPEKGQASVLTDAQRAFYEENGYLVFKNVVPLAELEKYRVRFEQICDGVVQRAGMMTVMRDVAIVKSTEPGKADVTTGGANVTKVQHFEDDPVLFSFCSTPDVVRIATAFTGKDIKSVHTMLINKPPDPGTLSSRHPLHQDLHYFPFRPADRIVCAWTAMQRVTRENGCLVVIPGTHKGELLEHGYPDWEGGVNKAYHGITKLGADVRRVHLEMDPGDTVFFHPILIHGSGANRTSGFRKSISCHYASSHCHYIEVRGTSQEVIAKEIEGILTKRGIEGMTYQDVWKVKGRLVGGEEGSL